jgi:ribosomal-protein-serine acetyltransferase
MFIHRIDDELFLRLPDERHSPEAYALIKRDHEHLSRWLKWATEDFTLEDAKEFVRRNRRQFANNEGYSTQIVYRDRIAGQVGYVEISWANGSCEIGYWLGAAFQGRGIMTRACRALIDYAFRELKLNRVEIKCAVGNTRSRAVPERLGFEQEGILREAHHLHDSYVDLVVYAMLAADWPRPEKTKRER